MAAVLNILVFGALIWGVLKISIANPMIFPIVAVGAMWLAYILHIVIGVIFDTGSSKFTRSEIDGSLVRVRPGTSHQQQTQVSNKHLDDDYWMGRRDSNVDDDSLPSEMQWALDDYDGPHPDHGDDPYAER